LAQNAGISEINTHAKNLKVPKNCLIFWDGIVIVSP
jgi:hypothetical protein